MAVPRHVWFNEIVLTLNFMFQENLASRPDSKFSIHSVPASVGEESGRNNSLKPEEEVSFLFASNLV